MQNNVFLSMCIFFLFVYVFVLYFSFVSCFIFLSPREVDAEEGKGFVRQGVGGAARGQEGTVKQAQFPRV